MKGERKIERGTGKEKEIGTRERVIYTEREREG